MKATRTEVYEAIDSERDYQDKMGEKHSWGKGEGASNHTTAEFILLAEEYLARARKAYAQYADFNEDALENVRKVAGILVNCMEKNGAPKRELPADLKAV